MDDVALLLEPLETEPVKSADGDSHIVKTAFGKKNRIMVGRPDVRRMRAGEFGYSEGQVERERHRGFEFLVVATSISFLPDFGCKFVASDLSFEFSTEPGTVHSEVGPVVCALKPREVVRENVYKEQRETGAKVSGSLSAGIAKLLSELTDSNSFEIDGKMMVRDLYGFGLNFPEAGWRFQASRGHELAGIYEHLLFAVKKRVGSALVGELKVGAEIAVEAALDRWVTMAFGLSRNTAAVQRVYELSPTR